jgi:hypothetical protein
LRYDSMSASSFDMRIWQSKFKSPRWSLWP